MMPTFPRSPLSFRTASFIQYGWKTDCPSGAFLGDRRLEPAPGIRRPPSSLHPPFVHFVVATVVRSELGLRTRSCTAMRWNTTPTPGALARVRVVVSRSVITQSAPSAPLAAACHGMFRGHRRARIRFISPIPAPPTMRSMSCRSEILLSIAACVRIPRSGFATAVTACSKLTRQARSSLRLHRPRRHRCFCRQIALECDPSVFPFSWALAAAYR
jgi:hypothetical protein